MPCLIYILNGTIIVVQINVKIRKNGENDKKKILILTTIN